jgi:outer membrane lipoprotein LolB
VRAGPLARAAAALLALLFSGCAAVQRAPERPAVDPAHVQQFELNGRINVRLDNQAYPGSLRWQHAPRSDELWFYTPVGSGVARLRQDEEGALVVTAEGREYRAEDLQALAFDVLGWDLPLESLPFWVRGVPSPSSPVTEEALDEQGRLRRLVQDGWQVSYLDWAPAGVNGLPSKLELIGERLRMRLVVDEWKL